MSNVYRLSAKARDSSPVESVEPPTPPKLAPLTARDREYIEGRAVSLEFVRAEGWHRAAIASASPYMTPRVRS